MWRQINTDECGEANSFVPETFITALNDCRDYLDELNIYIKNNKDYVRKLLKDKPYLNLVDNKSLYLIWIDVSKVCVDADKLCSFIRKNTGLYITSGSVYGTNSKSFVRINLATSLDNVKDGLNRFIRGIELFKEKGNI
jgi:cystathionine beta-lyase